MKKYSVLFLAILFLVGCGKTDYADLHKCWAQLENDDGKEIYILCNDPSLSADRYRQSYSFNKQGRCDYKVLASNDAHFIEEGTYKLKDNNAILEINDNKGDRLVSFEILNLSENELVLKRQ
ncbi:MAG: DNA polymerase III alpha subunit [Marivirga sp.]|jgi:hypothetical protein